MDWHCNYWLFLKALSSHSKASVSATQRTILAGPQKLRIWQVDGDFNRLRAPLWNTPWWLHQAGKRGFVATHLFHATPLAIGFGNNPFASNAEGADKDPKVQTTPIA